MAANLYLTTCQPPCVSPKDSCKQACFYSYDVVATTNMNGWTIPLLFEFASYDSYSPANSPPRLSGSGRLVSVRESEPPKNVFLPGKVQLVSGYRFRNEDWLVESVSYTRTNMTNYVDTDNPELGRLFTERLKHAVPARTPPSAGGNARVVRIGILLLVSGFFGWFIFGDGIRALQHNKAQSLKGN